MKFGVTFVREFQVEVEAGNLETAEELARRIIAQFPIAAACKLLSVVAGSNVAATRKAKRRRAS